MLSTCSLHKNNVTIKSICEKNMESGGTANRNCYQLVHNTHSLQQEFDPNEMRRLWNKASISEYGSFIDQPTLTLLENSINGYKKHMIKRTGYFLFFKVVCNLCNTARNKNNFS